MPATRITINTDKFFKGPFGPGTPGDEKYAAASRVARQAVAKTLRALADELDKGAYVGNFALPMQDASNWTEEQCLEAIKKSRRYTIVQFA
jgi:hypothetical protein